MSSKADMIRSFTIVLEKEGWNRKSIRGHAINNWKSLRRKGHKSDKYTWDEWLIISARRYRNRIKRAKKGK